MVILQDTGSQVTPGFPHSQIRLRVASPKVREHSRTTPVAYELASNTYYGLGVVTLIMILSELFVRPLSHQKELLAIPSVVSILGPSEVMYKYLHGPIRIYASHTLMGPRALYRPLRPFCN